jgi:hypothetical protein
MNVVKLTLAAATITLGLATSVSAMPLPNLGTVDLGTQVDQVRTICNAYGRCWWVPSYRYRYGYGRGYGWRGGYRRGYRRY